ncbi:MAG: ferritin [bacterium]
MVTKNMEMAINQQLNDEFFSSYLYLSMAAYFESVGLMGFANWMHIQAKEENMHAMKFYKYISERGGRIKLHQIEAPKTDWESPADVFNEVIEHEKKITKSINELINLALDEKDHATNIFLQWFITEQIEEEANVNDVINQLKLMANAPGGLFIIDRELAQRVFVPPVDAKA